MDVRTYLLVLFLLLSVRGGEGLDCCLPLNRRQDECRVKHVVYVPERERMIAITPDGKRLIHLHLDGPSFVPEELQMTSSDPDSHILRYNGRRMTHVCDKRPCLYGRRFVKVFSTVDSKRTMIHMRVDDEYFEIKEEDGSLIVVNQYADCNDLGTDQIKEMFNCSGRGKEEPQSGWQVESYSRFKWKNGKTFAMALTESGFFCVYEWKDESSDNLLSRSRRTDYLMPECFPQAIFFGCELSICDSPIIETIDNLEHGWELIRGSRSLTVPLGENGILHPLISPTSTLFENEAVPKYGAHRGQYSVSAIAKAVPMKYRSPQNFFFVDNGLIVGDDSIQKLSALFDPAPRYVTAAWRNPDNHLLVFSNNTYAKYIKAPSKDKWMMKGVLKTVSKDFIGVESIDSIFETPDELVVVVSRGRYATANRSDWKGAKYDFHPIPYHPIHNPKGIVDIDVCNWTDREAKAYFECIDAMFKRNDQLRDAGHTKRKTGWMSQKLIWILIGLLLTMDVLIVAVTLTFIRSETLRTRREDA